MSDQTDAGHYPGKLGSYQWMILERYINII